MAHVQQIEFCLSVKQRFPDYFRQRWVLDVGSLDINGNNQFLFEDCAYIGIDLLPGKNVDFCCKAHEFKLPDHSFDVIISTECFEHDPYYALTLQNMVRLLKPGGLLLFSCATTGRPEHGTRRTTPADAPFIQAFGDWGDYYRNLGVDDIRAVLDVEQGFSAFEFSTQHQTHDLYFWGIKQGECPARDDYSFLLPDSMLSSARLAHTSALQQSLAQQAALQEALSAEEAQRCRLSALVEEQERVLIKRAQHVSEQAQQIRLLGQTIRIREAEQQTMQAQQATMQSQLQRRDAQLVQLQVRMAQYQQQLSQLHQSEQARIQRIQALLSSRSWRWTRPARGMARLCRGDYRLFSGSLLDKTAISRLQRGMRYLLRGHWATLYHRWQQHLQRFQPQRVHAIQQKAECASWVIMTPEHTLFVAHRLQERLRLHGWGCEVVTQAPEDFSGDMYIVLCPQIFDRLPPGEKRIAFQLEQSVSERWFTEAYFTILENSLAVLDYAQTNISYLARHGIVYPHIYYLPIGASRTFGGVDASERMTTDVLFYGDALSSPRRQLLLAALQQQFSVKVVNALFGTAMTHEIQAARVVINLHYYDNALLEMPRIQECLSLGVPVVSETAPDMDEYPELQNAVVFFEAGSIEDMLRAVEQALTQPHFDIAASVSQSSQRFDFMFDRFLLAKGFLPPAYALQMRLPLNPQAEVFGLSLPETSQRRAMFQTVRPNGCELFDGMRFQPGWLGCGLSYSLLARHALRHQQSAITIMEDDVLLPEHYHSMLRVIQSYLRRHAGEWDIFTGLIASLHPDTRVLKVEITAGLTFVTLDKMTSMVYNIYAQRALEILSQWDPTHLDAEVNTIDRFLESRQNLRVVTTLPFFVGHREEVTSTLWGFENTRYATLIAASEAALREKVEAYLATHQVA